MNSRAVYGNNCPYCGHRRILPGFNDLATNNPGLAAEWNHKRNGRLKPTNVMPGSNRVVWWRCCECGEEWQAPVKERPLKEYAENTDLKGEFLTVIRTDNNGKFRFYNNIGR